MTEIWDVAPVTRAFEAHSIDNRTFHHAEHVRVAFDLLRKYDFVDAASLYAKGIRSMAAKAGEPHKFNLTITYAFMSLIAERMAADAVDDFDAFVAANADLMTKHVLANWYSEGRLHTETARKVFLLPDRVRESATSDRALLGAS